MAPLALDRWPSDKLPAKDMGPASSAYWPSASQPTHHRNESICPRRFKDCHWTRAAAIGESVGMIAQRYRLYFERKDPGRNMARFYAMSIEETLFGQICLTRSWGRIGTSRTDGSAFLR